MIDLTNAISCIERMKKEGHHKREKIGIIVESFPGVFPLREKGDVVLFSEELYPSDSDLCMGEYAGMEQKPTGTVKIEIPFSKERIDKYRGGRFVYYHLWNNDCCPFKICSGS